MLKKGFLLLALMVLAVVLFNKFKTPILNKTEDVVVASKSPKPTSHEAKLSVKPTIRDHLLKELRNEEFAQLDTLIESTANDFDKAKISEEEFDYVLDSIVLIDPSLEALFLKWVESTKSWSAYLITARYYDQLAWQWRGTSLPSLVPEHNMVMYQSLQKKSYEYLLLAKQNNNRDSLWYKDRIKLANQNGDLPEEQFIDEAIAKFPKSYGIFSQAIHAQQSNWGGNEFKRQELIHKAIAIREGANHEHSASSYFYEAISTAKDKDYTTAVNLMEKTIELNPNRVGYYLTLSRYYEKLDQHKKALSALNVVLEYWPYDRRALRRRANTYVELKKYDLALNDIQLLLKYEPYHLKANNTALKINSLQGNREASLEGIERASYFSKHDPRQWVNLAYYIRYNLKDNEFSKKLYKKAVDINELDVGGNYNLATLYGRQESCQVVSHLYRYFQGCKNRVGDARRWCAKRYKNWAYSSVNYLNSNKKCPEITEYDFTQF